MGFRQFLGGLVSLHVRRSFIARLIDIIAEEDWRRLMWSTTTKEEVPWRLALKLASWHSVDRALSPCLATACCSCGPAGQLVQVVWFNGKERMLLSMAGELACDGIAGDPQAISSKSLFGCPLASIVPPRPLSSNQSDMSSAAPNPPVRQERKDNNGLPLSQIRPYHRQRSSAGLACLVARLRIACLRF